MQGRFPIPNRWWGFTADGAYAPIKHLNGDSSDVVGALWTPIWLWEPG